MQGVRILRIQSGVVLACALSSCTVVHPKEPVEYPKAASATLHMEDLSPRVVSVETDIHRQRGYVAMPLFRKPKATGVVVRQDGYVLTPTHVVQGAQNIWVYVQSHSGGHEIKDAKLIASDQVLQFSLLKIDHAFPIQANAYAETALGDDVSVITRPDLRAIWVRKGTLSRDRLGAPRRRSDLWIHVDIPPMLLMSGGLLVNARMDLVGVLHGQLGQGSGLSVGVPMALIHAMVEDMIVHGHVRRSWLGVQLNQVSTQTTVRRKPGVQPSPAAVQRFVQVTHLINGGPAMRCGLLEQDQILVVDGHAVEEVADISEYVELQPEGTKLDLTIERAGQQRQLSCATSMRPKEQ